MVRVEVYLKDGTRLEKTVQAGRGNEKDFASEADIVEKFEKLACHVLPRAQVETIRDWMLGLEQQADAGDIMKAQYSVPFCLALALYRDPEDPGGSTSRH